MGNSMVSYRFSMIFPYTNPLRYPSVTSAEVLLHGPQLVSGRAAAGGRGTRRFRSLAQRPVAAAVSQVATRRPGKAWGGWWDAGYCWLGDIQRCHENPISHRIPNIWILLIFNLVHFGLSVDVEFKMMMFRIFWDALRPNYPLLLFGRSKHGGSQDMGISREKNIKSSKFQGVNDPIFGG